MIKIIKRSEFVEGKRHSRDYGDRISAGDRWVPFTAERWRSLCRLRAAMIDIRGRIAGIMADESGEALDAVVKAGGLPGMRSTPLLADPKAGKS